MVTSEYLNYLIDIYSVVVQYLFDHLSNNYRTTIEQLSNNYGRKSLGKVILSWMGYGRIEVYQIMITLFKILF